MSASDEEPLNLLSFDGGGVRGVSSLVILHEIMIKIQKEYGLADIPKPCDIFHMIAGTSTGGLIAIMLGRLRMSTEEALREYDTCAEKIFSKRKKTNVLERFRSTPLQETIEDLVKRRDVGELMRDPTNPPKGKVVVCVLPAKQALGDARRVRSYKSKENWDKDFKIWEAARATTAASSYFKPQSLTSGSETEDYIDAALGNNNPINHLLSEASEQFGLGRRLGCLVSIGTGTRKGEVIRAKSGLTNLFHLKRAGGSLIDALKNKATDAEAAHNELEKKFYKHPGVYFRFNVDDAAAKVKLHEYNKMKELKVLTSQYTSRTDVDQQLLLAAQVLETASAKDGLTLGHIQLDPTQIIKAGQKAQLMGEASQFFTGRDDILRKLNSFFSERPAGPFSRRQFCLYGMGGLGKTQIALKVANIFRTNASDPWAVEGSEPRNPRFKHILYIDGTDAITISQSYANIARDEFDFADGRPDDLKARVLRKLAQLKEDWFLIYDNCNQEDRRGFLPVGDSGNILYTTRNRLIRDQMRPECAYDVPVLEELDASRFLLTASGPKYEGLNAWDLSLAQVIVTELGFLPLAIDQAAAYIRAGECRLDEYINVFRNQKAQLLKDPRFKGSLPQNQAVYTTFEASYKAIVAMKRREGRSQLGISADFALRILDLICFWHNEHIPMDVTLQASSTWITDNVLNTGSSVTEEHLKRLTGCSTMTWEEFFFVHEEDEPNSVHVYDGFMILERYSIVDFWQPGYAFVSMHVLIHSWARDRMTDQKRARQSAMSKALLLQSVYTGDNDLIWRTYNQSLSPHVHACTRHSQWEAGLIPETYELELMTNFAYLLRSEKRFGESELWLLRAHRVAKLAHGPESPLARSILRNLSRLYRQMGRLGDAEACLLQGLDLMKHEIDVEKKEAKTRATKQLRELASCKPRRSKEKVNSQQLKEEQYKENFSVKDPKSMAVFFEPSMKGSLRGDLKLSYAEEELAMVYWDQGEGENCQVHLESAYRRRKKILHPENFNLWSLEDKVQRHVKHADHKYWTARFRNAYDKFRGSDLDSTFPASEYAHWLRKTAGDSILELREAHGISRQSRQKVYKIAYDGWYEDLLKPYRKYWGDNDSATLELTRSSILCLVGMGRGEEAETLARKCLSDAIVGYGECHEETILALEALYYAIVCRLGAPDFEACYAIKEASYRADGMFGEEHPYTLRMIRESNRAMDNLDMTLSTWLPLGQDVVDDPHWSFGTAEDNALRVELLGPQANEHKMSYTIHDPSYHKLLEDVLRKRAEQEAAITQDTGPSA